ncbi:class II SORL domain-containing protein [Geobacter sulfurreducens]|jgi:superoxide reductase|uniref:Desulfoferrodoxin, putative n=1 Tax=Geobacter sulfurreducens (strain ATCC 51573 / DSM 12127 / PCA) TaxID=243231 RepID=Q74F89_GEOSL|nr:class II SORL domain-containing protein [Geobacter sulfurreducens]BET59129.1 class II SORL domain-containing protein [Geobacter sp. 60473]AAR34050.1 desulfoferrodoxin, putative [Geobacter sulfurreducens PCA]ADI83561.1 desulfoferrodoxin, putative [Geobacter sulfurreducens KN400]AJY70467.1 desulfoferrodoxin [Geobacter sulfurreducens]QVW35976.1 class II SORL domain-containing protein [Geobacter sulfurreducens]
MDRRTFLKTAALGAMAAGIAREAAAAGRYYPVKADQSLFETINRAKDPAKKSPLEQKHVPVITAPKAVKAGEPFTVEVAVGEVVHPMGPTHWIQFIELNVGNEPAGRVDMQPRGFLSPKATFTVTIPKEAAPEGKITLVVNERCNLHGYWEGSIDIAVTG